MSKILATTCLHVKLLSGIQTIELNVCIQNLLDMWELEYLWEEIKWWNIIYWKLNSWFSCCEYFSLIIIFVAGWQGLSVCGFSFFMLGWWWTYNKKGTVSNQFEKDCYQKVHRWEGWHSNPAGVEKSETDVDSFLLHLLLLLTVTFN